MDGFGHGVHGDENLIFNFPWPNCKAQKENHYYDMDVSAAIKIMCVAIKLVIRQCYSFCKCEKPLA